MPQSRSSRKRTRTRSNNDRDQSRTSSNETEDRTAPKRQRNSASGTTNNSSYSLRNRTSAPASTQLDPSQTEPEINPSRYNLRPRRIVQTNTTPTTRQYRLLYISDDDGTTSTNETYFPSNSTTSK